MPIFFCWTDRCFRLRHKVQDLLDQEPMNFETDFKLNGFKKRLLHGFEAILYIEIGMTIGLTLEERRERFLSQPFFVVEVFMVSPGKYVGLRDSLVRAEEAMSLDHYQTDCKLPSHTIPPHKKE